MRWKSHAKFYDEALVYMKKRQQGLVKSLITPWAKINDAGIKGFEWNSVVIIAARPGGGKTLMLQQLTRMAFKLNKGQNIRVLDFQLEMVGRNSKIREFSSVSKKSYKYLCSAERENIVIDDELIAKCAQYAKAATKYPIDIVEDSVTAEEFELEIREYMKFHSAKDADGKVVSYKKTIVSLDHSVLLKKMKGQSTIDKLNSLGEACTKLKKQYPIIFIILSQLNREITTPVRCENGKYGNYPNSNDIFGGDALNQHADMLIVLDRPALRHITEYGPDRYIVEDDTLLAAHILKTRTGDTRMSFFEARFHEMSIEDAPVPPQAKKSGKRANKPTPLPAVPSNSGGTQSKLSTK